MFSQQVSTPKVEGETGALTQEIPIDIPPGRNGLQPALSLNYNSQDTEQDNEVGYGWSLSIPYVERLNKTGTQDLYSSNAYFTSSIDGELAVGATTTITTGTSTVSTLPVAYWKFDNSSAADATGNGNTLSCGANCPSYGTGIVFGAAQFQTANNQSFSLSNASSTGLGFTGDFTLGAWIKLNTLPVNTDYGLIGKWTSHNSDLSYELNLHGSGSTYSLEAGISSGGTSATAVFKTANYAFSTGTWYYVSAVYTASAGSMEFYINGSSIGTVTGFPTSIYSSNSAFLVGDYNGGAPFDGLIDEAGLWNQALSSTTIAALYNGGTGIQYPFYSATSTAPSTYLPRVDNGGLDSYSYSTTTDSWTMYDKKGNEYLFGASSQSRQGTTTSQTGTVQTFKWMLEKEIDPNGNFIRYAYWKDHNQIYPWLIYYTGHGSTDGPFSISFATSSRTDAVADLLPGFEVDTDYRISQLSVAISSTTVRQYNLSYTTGNNGSRSLLASVQENGWNVSGTETTLPAWTFGYMSSTSSFVTLYGSGNVNGDYNVAADANGDGVNERVDLNCGLYEDFLASGVDASPPQVNGLCWSFGTNGNDQMSETGTRFVDINGDGKADIVQSESGSGGSAQNAYLTNYTASGGYSWTSTTLGSSTPTIALTSTGAFPVITAGIFGDVNGTGLPSFTQYVSGQVSAAAYLASGAGWNATTTEFTPPMSFPSFGSPDCADSQLVDVNGDGLPDWVYTDGTNTYVDLNSGTGWHSTPDATWTIGTSTVYQHSGACFDRGMRFVDINGDGLPDLIHSYTNTGNTAWPESDTYQLVYLNTGHGWATSTAYSLPTYVITAYNVPPGVNKITYDDYANFIGNGQQYQDVLSTSTNPKGGITSATYGYTTESGTNPKLPYNLLVVTKSVTDDGRGNKQETDYSYGGGLQYLPTNVFDRKFAGFASATTTNSQSTVVTYYSQGATSTAIAAGDQSDGYGQLNHPYREDTFSPSGTLVQSTFFQYNPVFHDNSEFVGLTRQLEQDYASDGTTHFDKDTDYSYSSTTDDLLQALSYGPVTGNSNGTFSTSSATSLRMTNISYAASSTINLSVPTEKKLFNNSNATTSDTKYFYDGLSFGQVGVGNQTQEQDWATSTTYASTTKLYNSYGLVSTSTDADGNATTYVYDASNLYPATTTNALAQTTSYRYNYSNGKVASSTDPNGMVIAELYDGVGRPIEIDQSDITTPATLDTKTTYAYTDSTSTPSSITKTDYLNSATSSSAYDYYDGLSRLIQERKQTETAGTYAVTDTIYDNTGKTASTSLPYFSTGSSRTTAASSSALFTSYTYDPLGRTLTIANAVGTTTNTYSAWTTTTLDPNGKRKDFYRDAFGNLANVVEYPGVSPATTTYTYDAADNLANLTDANGNVRNFAYDGLRRLLSSQDLHTSTSSSFGTWTYSYDDAGNTTQRVDPKSQTVTWTYDKLNRPLTEALSGTGTTTTYTYDSCTNGTGHLCSASSTAALDSFAYDILGETTYATTTVGGTAYAIGSTYDRQGNITTLKYPNGSQILYTYNNRGLLQAISRTPSGGLASNILSSITYAPTGQEYQKTFGNGASTTDTYDANHLYRLQRLQTGSGAAPSLQDLNFTYDALGNILSLTDNSGSAGGQEAFFTYDALSRLLTASTTATSSLPYARTFAYDPLGNMTELANANSSNLNEVPTSYWKLDESSGVAHDAAASNNLTNNNSTAFVSAKINNGGSFVLVNDNWFSITNASSTGLGFTGDFTFGAWIKLNTLPVNTDYGLIGKWTSHNTDLSYELNLHGSGPTYSLEAGISSGGTSATAVFKTQNYAFSTGTWYYITAVYTASSGSMQFYVNGSSIGTATGFPTSIATTTSNFLLGDYNGGAPFDGLIDEVGMWPKALNATEVTSLYNSGNGLPYPFGVPVGANLYSYGGTGYPNPDAVTQIANGTATSTIFYDHDGNILSIVSGATSTTYAFDYRNRLIGERTTGDLATTSYGYDAFDNRVFQGNGSATTTYPSKYYSVVTAANASSTGTSTEFIFEPGRSGQSDLLVSTVDQPLVNGAPTGTPVTRYVHLDYLGSTEVASDASGTVAQFFSYAPYGSVLSSSNTGTTSITRQYIGQFTDPSGLSYLNARYYNPVQGQFTSEDPMFLGDPSLQSLSDPQSLNSYSYSDNNPITGSDPTGKAVYLTASGVSWALGQAYHLGYYISPDPGSRFANVGDFSLNGEPQDGSIPHLTLNGWSWGNLQGEVGYAANGTATPLPSNSNMYTKITPANGHTEDELIKELLRGNAAVNNADVSYAPFGNQQGRNNGNSNNLAYTLAQFAGISEQFNSFSSQFYAPGDNAGVPNIIAAHNASLGGGGVSSSGASLPNPNSWWSTPSGAVVTWGGSLVAAPATSQHK